MSDYDLTELLEATSYSECLACVPTQGGVTRDPKPAETWAITKALINLGLDIDAVDRAVGVAIDEPAAKYFAHCNLGPVCISAEEFISIVKAMLDAKAQI